MAAQSQTQQSTLAAYQTKHFIEVNVCYDKNNEKLAN